MKDMHIQSKAFMQNETIPSKFTCDGINVSPPLEWSDFPSETKSFALICDDPDALRGTFVHWVVYNIPVTVTKFNEHFIIRNNEVKEIRGGINGMGQTEYSGPCPPGGTHRYFFKIFALDIMLNEREGLSSADLHKKIENHVIAKSDLMGKYSRK